MSRLSSQEQLFVLLFFENGGNQTEALMKSGLYEKEPANRNSAWRTAYYYVHKKAIMDAIKEEHERRNMLMVPKIQAAVERLIDAPEHQDHFKAIKFAADNAGITRAVERVLNVKVEVNQQEKIAAIKAFAIAHDIDPQKLLGFDPDAENKQPIDAEFAEIDVTDVNDLL